MDDLADFARAIPKAELHLHIEGTLEPEMLFSSAERNGQELSFSSVDEVRSAYEFTDLQSFLDIYYQGAAVLQTEDDFYELMLAYLETVQADGVRHAEIFFDPETHTGRNVPFITFMEGFARAQAEAADRWDTSSSLIMCFLRHLDPAISMATLTSALPFKDRIVAVGLDSYEVGNPPEKFSDVFAAARAEGLAAVAHAGEEGPAAYISSALDALHAQRIEHGVRCEDDDELVERLASERVPLTMCPLSNVKLRAFEALEDHNLKRLLDRGLLITINSDDPAYFGGYVGENYAATAIALGLSRDDVITLAKNSFEASFLSDEEKAALIEEVDAFVSANS